MKKPISARGASSCTFKPSLKMKLTVFLTIVSLFQIQANTYSQSKKITLDMPDSTVEEVIQEIESLSDFKCLLNRKDVDLNREVSIKVEKQKIATVLSELFAGTDVGYEVLKKQIVLRKISDKVDSSENSVGNTKNEVNVQFQVSGTITDGDGTPLPGASILEKGTTNGVQTDFDGNFSIAISDENATLVLSYIGFATQEVAVDGQATINVQLEESAQGLDEVVVVGFGTQKKSDLTGAVASANIDAFRESPNVSIAQSLQGSVPGLNVGQVNSAGESPSISVRGRTSINGNQNPFIVLDGIPFSGNLSDLNPNDIESINVLKDPSSKAIYGAQSANGVILIESKKGLKRESKPIFSYSGSYTT